MKTYWWKIGVAAALVLAVVITAGILWPPRATLIAQSTDIGPQSRTQESTSQAVTACPTGALAFKNKTDQPH